VAQSVRVERFLPVERESPLELTLAQAIAASDAMDSAVRKATELGVAAIQPLVTARSAPMPGRRARRKARRSLAAGGRRGGRASGRNRIPQIAAPRAFAEWLAGVAGNRNHLAAGRVPTARALAPQAAPLAVAIGPEGGFDAREAAAATARGFTAVRLGRGCCGWTPRLRRRSPSPRRRGGIGDDAMDAFAWRARSLRHRFIVDALRCRMHDDGDLATRARWQRTYAFVVLGEEGRRSRRVITPAATCPPIQIDGKTEPMEIRARPETVPLRPTRSDPALSKPSAFPVLVCDKAIPAGAGRASVLGAAFRCRIRIRIASS
jgi:hypothetical protein